MNANLEAPAVKNSSSGLEHLFSNASALVGSSALNSVLGFVYWGVAARWLYADQREVVGFTLALVPLMLGLASLAMLGLGNTLIGELPKMQHNRGRLISAALISTGLTGALIGLLAIRIIPSINQEFVPLRDNLPLGLMFVCGLALTTVGSILDEALIGMLRGKLQLWRNALFAVLKLVLLLTLSISSLRAAGGSNGLFATWVLGLGAAFVLLALAMRSEGLHVLPKPDFSSLWKTRKTALGHHAINMAYLGTGNIMPVIVTGMLGASANASFYFAWQLAGFGFFVPLALATVLHAMNAADKHALAIRLRSSLGMSALLVTGYALVLLFGAHLILGIFGKQYALEAETSLQILAFAILPVVVKTHYMTLGRIQNQLVRIAQYAAVGTVLELTLAVIGARLDGMTGLCLGYVIALYLEAVYAGRVVYTTAFPSLISSRLARSSLSNLNGTASAQISQIPSVCALIVSYNRLDQLRDCLRAVQAQTRQPEHIVVIDNASEDGTYNAIRLEFANVEIVHLNLNTGPAGGFSKGFERALASNLEFVWTLDDDCVPEANALEMLLETLVSFPKDSRPSLLSSYVVWKDGTPHPMNRPVFGISWRQRNHWARREVLASVRATSFVSTLINLQSVAKHGLPWSAYYFWNDDVEYTARLLRDAQGYAVPNSTVMHSSTRPYVPLDDSSGRYFYEVRNKLWMVRFSSAWTVPERIGWCLYLSWSIMRYLGRNRLDQNSRSIVKRGLEQGLWSSPAVYSASAQQVH
jgi:GT2 family glycosyltransferase/O-antigen/teichoic acid export membrane protein